ncbi:Na+/H+ antiporter subunit E [Williamsia sp. CHRR-6]|uniref:Na+/H+ antiporter subunit E n=1 Tax=Williamsia sp. CHRR-6 TaxID=2835871 RepID=UPI001BDA71F1|nr:Na+/H+ antiporter subunit E [Williamsia sp. CHRR-6]MBT0567023.1 Na+/H+ antiporter subunit E [Williamsia sp. CHRR-6]
MSADPDFDDIGPAPTKGPIRGWLQHVWRVGFITMAWNLTRSIVWVRTRYRPLAWLGSDSREIAVRLWVLGWLTFVWVLLWGTISWANILGGIAVGLGVVYLLPLPRVPVEGRVHPATVAVLLLTLIRDFVISSAQVAYLAVRPGRPPLSAVLRTRLAIKSDMVLTLVVDYINLVPGTMVVEIDHRRRLLYVHVIDVGTEKKVKAFYAEMARVERMFIRAFERDSEWHRSPYHGIDDDVAPPARVHRAPATEPDRTRERTTR